MDFKGDSIECSNNSNGGVVNLLSINNGVVLSPNPIDISGTIGLVADLQYNETTGTLTLGKNNSVGDNTALHNISIGDNAGSAITSADDNINIGHNAGRYNQEGNRNTFVGTDAGVYTTGGNNTYIGYASGLNNNSGFGNYNTAIGSEALYNSTSRSLVAVGYQALRENVSGDNLVAIGAGAMGKIGIGGVPASGNLIGIGTNCMRDVIEAVNSVVIGHENLNGITALNNMVMYGNANMDRQTDDFIADDCIVVGNNNFSGQSDCPEFQHDGAIVLGNNASNNINLGQAKQNLVLIGNNLPITSDMVSNTSIIAGTNHSLGNFTPIYNVETQGINALRSKASVNSGIPVDNFAGLKVLNWNWSAYAYMASGVPTVLFDVNMEQIKWDTQTIQDDDNGKSVLFTLEFNFNGTNAGRSALTTFGGSVSFLVLKNAGQWVFPSLTTVVNLTTNAGNRGYYQYSTASFNGIYVYQPSLGSPEIQVGILWDSVPGEPLLNSTVSTNVSAVLATNLVDGPASPSVIPTVDNAYILSHV
jgi:hypothetical protein